MSTPILATKLYIPPPRAQLILRPRLTYRLSESLHLGQRLTLISAPPGFGKTTLLSEWLYGMGSRDNEVRSKEDFAPPTPKTAWVSLDEHDNDPVRFWSYVITALEKVQPGVGQEAMTLLHSPQPPPFETILTVLINTLTIGAQQILLILDDYHVIQTDVIHQALAFLLDHLPPHLHVIITSRVDPPLPLTRLRVRSQLTELRESDLRFTLSEAVAFFNQVMRLNLAPEDVMALERRTEGWIAGLQLAALSIQGQADTTAFVQAFTGSHRYVFDYLAEEILSRQSESIQQFLLRSSILERLCGPLCDAVLEMKDGDAVAEKSATGQEILEYLDRVNLFLIPLDGERRWYRYHHLFADFLRARLRQQIGPAEIAALYSQAGDWYTANGFTAEAINHFLAAGNMEQAANLMEQILLNWLTYGEAATVINWVKSLPEVVVNARPRLTLGLAWAWVIVGQWDKIMPLVQITEKVLAAADPPPQPASVIQGMRGEMAALRTMLMARDGLAAEAIEICRQALEALPPENVIVRSIILRNLGLGYEMLGQLEQASQSLRQAKAIAEASDNLIIALTASNDLGRIEEDRGFLFRAAELYHQAIQLAEQKVGVRGGPQFLAKWAYRSLAEVLREQNKLEEAKRYLTLTIELESQMDTDDIPTAVSHLILARILQVEGDAAGAQDAIQQAARSHTAEESPVFHWVGAVQARLWLAQGHLTEAVHWAETCGLPLGQEFNYHLYPGEYASLGRVWLAQGQLDRALALLAEMQSAAQLAGQSGRLVEIYLLQALALSAQGQAEAALTVLAEALVLGEIGGYIRLFADEGVPMAELLLAASRRPLKVNRAYLDRLLAAFPHLQTTEAVNVTPLTNADRHPPTIPLVEPLSDRELELLRLVATGLSNQEIADRLVIAEGTVKKHLHNIFGKLDARSRTQAIVRATELNLL